MHEMLPKASVEQNQGQGAFRHLFGDDDDGEDTLPIPSPQFKKIWADFVIEWLIFSLFYQNSFFQLIRCSLFL